MGNQIRQSGCCDAFGSSGAIYCASPSRLDAALPCNPSPSFGSSPNDAREPVPVVFYYFLVMIDPNLETLNVLIAATLREPGRRFDDMRDRERTLCG